MRVEEKIHAPCVFRYYADGGRADLIKMTIEDRQLNRLTIVYELVWTFAVSFHLRPDPQREIRDDCRIDDDHDGFSNSGPMRECVNLQRK